MKKVLITGANGIVGNGLTSLLKNYKEYEIYPLSRQKLSISNEDHVRIQLQQYQPDIIVNLAAKTDVEACEYDFKRTMIVNSIGPLYLATHSPKGCKIIHISSASVFGKRGTLIPENNCNNYDWRLNVYSLSKIFSEIFLDHHQDKFKRDNKTVHIIRTCGVFGGGPTADIKFIGKIFERLIKNEDIVITDDIRLMPIYVDDLSKFIKHIIDTDKNSEVVNYWHATSENSVSRYELTIHIKELLKSISNINFVENKSNKKFVKRPTREYLCLEKTEQFWGWTFRTWEAMINDYILNKF